MKKIFERWLVRKIVQALIKHFVIEVLNKRKQAVPYNLDWINHKVTFNVKDKESITIGLMSKEQSDKDDKLAGL